MKQVAIITGASSGMGRELTLYLAKQCRGIDEFWLIARRKERLRAVAGQLSGQGIHSVLFVGDLCDERLFRSLSARLQAEHTCVLFLVNAAGFGKLGQVEALSAESQEDMLRLNCGALLRLTRLCLPYLLNGRGRIINFASAAAFLPQPSFAVYAATKAFVLSFSEALREELKPRRITVTAVCPGPVKTEFFALAEEQCSVPLYKRLFFAKPGPVARKALRDSLLGRPLSVYGSAMRLFRLFARLLPHPLIFAVMRRLNQKAGQSL